MENRNPSPRSRVQQQVQAALERSARTALEKHRAFAREHRTDTREQLLDYVRQCAQELGHTPIPAEVVGSPYLASQFPGGWAQVICEAKLPKLETHYGKVPADLKSEYERQTQLRHMKKQKRMERKRAMREASEQAGSGQRPKKKRSAQEAARQAQQQEADRLWGLEHGSDTDEQLLDYLRQCAATLPKGQALHKNQVLGSGYIARRFGSWTLALHLAGLPLPEGSEPVTSEQETAYERRRQKENAAGQLLSESSDGGTGAAYGRSI